MTATPSTPSNRLARSRVIRFLTNLLMGNSSRQCAVGSRQEKGALGVSCPLPTAACPLFSSDNRRRDGGAHRALEHDLLEVVPLARLRLHPTELVDHRVGVVHQLGLVEAQLADDGVDVAAGVVAELDLAGGVFADRVAD